MVVLVRCNDDTVSVALESCLEGLVKGRLIKAWLSRGEWVTVPARPVPATRRRAVERPAAAAAA